MDKIKVAILITCHNRKLSTLKCLESLYKNTIYSNNYFKVFLVDDGSTDGTSDALKTRFPEVHIVQGNGKLFWNQGMRLAWETALNTDNFDFFIWLNDDTILHKNAITHLLECRTEILLKTKKNAIITGACMESIENQTFSYGARTEEKNLEPNGDIQYCKYINGNIVLVPDKIYKQLGILSNDYTHGMGDYDYGLQAQEMGFLCATTKEYIAVCPLNKGVPNWCNPKISLRKRLEAFNSPLGLNIKEYTLFRKKFWKLTWWIYVLKAYLKVYFPNTYSKL